MFEAEDIDRGTSGRVKVFPHTCVRPAPLGPENRSAVSLVELMLIVVILGVFAVVAVPRLNYAIVTGYTAEAAAKKIVTDLRRVRGLAIANAATNTYGFSLNIIPTPCSYEIKNLDGGTTLESHVLDSEVVCTGGTTFEFAPLGNLTGGSDTQMTVSGAGKSFTITIAPATGMVTCTEN